MYMKYPRTFHLPWSEGITNDDKVLKEIPFEGKEIVVTVKMDGENTTMYHDHIHARSIDSANHESRNMVKGFWGSIKYNIPEGDRICGENLFAEHSIEYDNLPSYFMGFSYWEGNTCLDWDETWNRFKQIGITPVYVAYRGMYNRDILDGIWEDIKDEHEGYVVRLADSFEYDDFDQCVAKFVRKGHVQTDTHWMHKKVKPNGLKQ